MTTAAPSPVQCPGGAGPALGHRAEGRQEQDYADGLTFDNVGMFIIFFILFGEGL